MMYILFILMINSMQPDDCTEYYGLTHQYDVVVEQICYNVKGIDWDRTRLTVHDANEFVESRPSDTPIRADIKTLLTKSQYDEISSYYADYQEAIRGATHEDTEIEYLIYKQLVDEVL